MAAPIRLRPACAEDTPAIEVLTLVGYLAVQHSHHDEHRVIAALREDGCLAVSLVAEHDGYLVGHAAASPVTVSDGGRDWYALGPLAVGPGHRGQGIGTCLIEAVLEALRARGAGGCVVLGEPAYYRRFGFVIEPGLTLMEASPWPLLALAFGDRLPPIGEIGYHPAFSF